ncbi:hypothetical protein ABWH92_02020 [Ahrensia marina]|uniref:hypothetical protein n=1 Tax=Ahrensia marina TaxID=1514904 RepID=UPI0035CEC865
MQIAVIDLLYAEYLRNQAGGACPVRAKRALQEICWLYSREQRLPSSACGSMEVVVLGQLESNIDDRKLRRWCLNVLALIGTASRSKSTIERVIQNYHNDPDTMASALTAYFKVEQGAFGELSGRSYLSPQQIKLAAHIGNFGARIRDDGTTINIDTEGTPILKSSLVAVGLGRAPENLFDPRFANGELVRQLSTHDHTNVAQYAVWAITENPTLTVQNLGFDIRDLTTKPANVRGWTYRLYGDAEIDDALRHEVITEGAVDVEPEARLNLARGIKARFYDGIEEVTCGWFLDEPNAEVGEEVLVHMVRQSARCGEYRRLALEVFEAEHPNSELRRRMFEAARGQRIYAEMKRLEIKGDGDLFEALTLERNGDIQVTNNYNIGVIQGGAVSLGGDAKSEGNITNSLTGNQIPQFKVDLHNLASELKALPSQTSELSDLVKLIEDTAENPSEEKRSALRRSWDTITSGTEGLAKFGGDITKIAGIWEKVAPYLI